jgi:hypothetical protein
MTGIRQDYLEQKRLPQITQIHTDSKTARALSTGRFAACHDEREDVEMSRARFSNERFISTSSRSSCTASPPWLRARYVAGESPVTKNLD